MKSRKGLFIYIFGLLPLINLIAAFSLYHFPGQSLVLFAILLAVSSVNIDKFDWKKARPAWIFIGFTLIVVLLSLLFNGEISPIGIISGAVYGYLCIILKNVYKQQVFDVFVKSFSFLLLLSLIEYLIFMFTGVGMELGIVYRSNYYPHYHLILNLIKVAKMRYQFIAAEPGDIGTLCGFLLFILDGLKQYRKQLYVFILAGLVSLSFAFYVFFALFILWNTSRIKLKQIVIFLVLTLIVGAIMYERIEQYIIFRYTEEQYDNRSSDSFDVEFEKYVKTSNFMVGKGYGATDKREDFSNVVGIKRELYEVGLIGVLCIFCAFSIPYFKINRISLKMLVFFTVFWLSYYQRSNIYNFGIVFLFFNIGALTLKNGIEIYGGARSTRSLQIR